MSYGEKRLVRMVFDEKDFAAGSAEVISFRLPYDEHGNATQGRLVNIGISVTELFANSLGTGGVSLGISGDEDKFADLIVPATQADETVCDVLVDPDAIILADIPADTLVEMNYTLSTDGSTIAGKGIPFVDIYVW